MAEANPPTNPDDKGQTVRINLPADTEESFEKTTPLGEKTVPISITEKTVPMTEKTVPLSQSNKGQTVRINTPPPADTSVKRETVVISTPPPGTPKKETTHLQSGAPTGSKPVLPPPPVMKPGTSGIPKPPLGGAKPMAPGAPAAPAAPQRPISPKKETARIQIPPQPKTPLHKATVKLEQPKPASVAPAASIAVAQTVEPVVAEDSSVGLLSWVVAAASLVAVVVSYLAYSA